METQSLEATCEVKGFKRVWVQSFRGYDEISALNWVSF